VNKHIAIIPSVLRRRYVIGLTVVFNDSFLLTLTLTAVILDTFVVLVYLSDMITILYSVWLHGGSTPD